MLDVLAAVGLTPLQSGMDNVRQITGSPIAGVDPHELADTRPLAKAVDDLITNGGVGNPELCNLPRKFNVSFSASRDDFVHSHINDLAFEAAADPVTGEMVGGVGRVGTDPADVGPARLPATPPARHPRSRQPHPLLPPFSPIARAGTCLWGAI